MEWLIEVTLRHPWRVATIFLAVLVVGGGLIWWQAVWQSPEQIFADMLVNNLATTSVTRTVNAGNKTQSIDQTIRLQMGSTNASDWLVAARQTGASVTTESIGTPSAGFVRYVSIGSKSDHQLDDSGLLNQWGKDDGRTNTGLTQLFAETILDVTNAPAPPIGNVPADKRAELLAFIADDKVFVPNYAGVKHEAIAGRSVDTYSVAVNLAAYVQLMKLFAHDLGLSRLDAIDPNQYVGMAPVTVVMSVDTLSHQLARVSYASSGFTQSYADWGLQPAITLPTKFITTTELQKRLEAAAKS
jgi:hypothetical protein